MGIDLGTWRLRIGTFSQPRKCKTKLPAIVITRGACSVCLRLACLLASMLLLSGDIEANPGPDTRQTRLTSSGALARERTTESQAAAKSKSVSTEQLSNDFSLLRQEVRELKTEVNNLQRENATLRRNVQYLEDQSRRDNLIFNGIEESANETWEDVENKIRETMVDKLGMENAMNDSDVGIERAHRLNVKHRQPNRPRPVIVKFSRFKTRDSVLRKAREITKNRREVNMRVSEDFSADVRKTRKEYIPFLIQAREEEKRAFLSYDKLVINGTKYILGQEQDRVYELNGRGTYKLNNQNTWNRQTRSSVWDTDGTQLTQGSD